MRPRFFAHQLPQGPSETVDPSDLKHTEFFPLDTASPARCPVQMQGKASVSCSIVHANWVFFESLPEIVFRFVLYFLLEEFELHTRATPKAL